MKIVLFLHTLCHLRPIQVVYQLVYRFRKSQYKEISIPYRTTNKRLQTMPIARQYCLNKEKNILNFLNVEDEFKGWNDTSKGMLWAYNLNYMDWLGQEDLDYETGVYWIEKFIHELPSNKIGLDPYPTALRGINWIKFIVKHKECISNDTLEEWNNSLYSQYMLLCKRLEYHLMGNHLLEDAFSLFIASIYFSDKKLGKSSMSLLQQELNEQILNDGAHYEQSPMYHCILLERLLDCYNFSTSNRIFEKQEAINEFLKEKAVMMLGHLESIVYTDHSLPLFNDAAYGIAPKANELFDYAHRLKLGWCPIPMNECGYRKLESNTMEAVIDIGDITATYQPGHTHADTLSYELRIDGKPVIVDAGISTYDKTPRRQYERSTAAHNTVSIDGRDSDEVWGGFRVGYRHKMRILSDKQNEVEACLNGFGNSLSHRRRFKIDGDGFSVEDCIPEGHKGVSYIHLAPGIEPSRVNIEGATDIEIVDEKISVEYNRFISTKVIRIYFNKKIKYTVQ